MGADAATGTEARKREEVLAEAAAEEQQGLSGQLAADEVLGRADGRPRAPVFVDRVLPNENGGEYHYFKPVSVSRTLVGTATTVPSRSGSLSAAEIGDSLAAEPPMMAVKVVLPYEETRKRHQ